MLTFVLLLPASPAWGYRPFISTDAALADPQEMQVELGYFNFRRTEQGTTVITPQIVLNYGLTQNWEIVGEFAIEKPPHGSAQLVDPGLLLKTVLREGTLQKKDGVSVAVEAGPLLPSTIAEERKLGFEGIGIVSGNLFPFTYHVNLGGGVDRAKANPFVIWGMIVELPIRPHFRLVAEVSGESVRRKLPDESVLWGFIWQPSSSSILFDAGVRRSLSRGAPEWQFTTGLTWGFSLPSTIGAAMRGGIP